LSLDAKMSDATRQLVENLNALATGLFLLTAFGIVAMRQARGCLHLFIAQSLLLAASAALLGWRFDSGHLLGVAVVNLISKPIIVPWLLRRTAPAEIYTRREIDQVLNIPTALAIALGLAIGAYFLGVPLASAVGPGYHGPNVPIGIAGLLLGAFTLTVRREALPLLIGLLAMENGAFLAGISIARDLPVLVELAIATDGLIIVLIVGVLVRAVEQHVGTTAVGELASLRETPSKRAAPETAR
jgi:hydrogenase-4 component E